MPSAKSPDRDSIPLQLGGPTNEANQPALVGANGLTASNNLMYRRFGSWGKRPGTSEAYVGGAGAFPNSIVSGYRFYRAYPTGLTQTIVAAEGALWMATDPAVPGGPPTPFTLIANFAQQNYTPVRFCVARDPQARGGQGSDILIIVGASLPTGSFALGQINFTGTPVAGQLITVGITPVGASGPINSTYTTLAVDNVGSVATAVATAINQSAAVVAGGPVLATSIATAGQSGGNSISTVLLGALIGGAAGNGIGISVSVTGTGLAATTSGATLAGGGGPFYGPLSWSGTILQGLSPFIPNAFTGCASWHNHVWYFGDPGNPLTVYASDINQPEGFTFMTVNGGYQIGDGTGGQRITALQPIGNILYAFNAGSSYAITGYDFQQGEYAFQVSPAIADSGVPYQECVVTLRNSLVYWSGSQFHKLVPGAFETERISTPIPFTAGAIANGTQSLIRGCAGSFTMLSTFGTTYTPAPATGGSPWVYDNIALFAVDTGAGIANTVLVYDEEASKLMQFPAWSTWTGWKVGAWIPFGSSMNAAQQVDDIPALYFIPLFIGAFYVVKVGGDPVGDNFPGAAGESPISWSFQTGWFDLGTPNQIKRVHRVYLDIEARAGLTLTGTLIASGPIEGVVSPLAPVALSFQPTIGQGANETFQQLIFDVNPELVGYRFMLIINDAGSNNGVEIVGARFDVIVEPFKP